MVDRKKVGRRVLRWCLLGFLVMNIIAFFHAWKFTHFGDASLQRTGQATEMSTGKKIRTLFTGVNNPKPLNTVLPASPYEVIRLRSNKEIECWYMPADSAIGSVVLFHGYGGEKSSMLDKAEAFRSLHYNVLLADFMGSGNSEGNQTTIGFKEAAEVNTCFDYLAGKGEKNIFLFGTSMGAAALMKAMADGPLPVKGIIIECPFGTMYKTVCARFRSMHAPVFPMAGLLVFWGGVQNGFWAFSHNPETYAKKINCPVLLMYGERDERVSRAEIDNIFNNMTGSKKLVTFPEAGHENYLLKYSQQWTNEISSFMGR